MLMERFLLAKEDAYSMTIRGLCEAIDNNEYRTSNNEYRITSF